MHTVPRLVLRTALALAFVSVVAVSGADAAVVSYEAGLDGAHEVPPVATPGLGACQVDIDPVAHTMRVQATFADLLGITTACHIHGPTLVAGTGNAGVMTTTPTFPGFPLSVSSGSYDQTFDMTLASSYNPSFITANGGTTASAEAALFAAIAAGKAYFNVHSNLYPGGEIRGYLVPMQVVPVRTATWGGIKALYR